MRLFLTGRMAIESSTGVVDERDLPGRQARLALAHLALGAQRPVSRDALADAIWGEDLPAGWEGALKALVSKLRVVLVRTGFDPDRAITTVSGSYQLRLPADGWVDLEACPLALDQAEAALRRDDIATAWSEATVASAIARRPFLPGEDLAWVDEVRSSLRLWRVRSIDCLTEVWLARGNPGLAISLASESIGLEPYRESAYRHLMRAHFLAGDRGEALRTFDRCARVLHAELGVEPHPDTVALRDQFRSGSGGR
ncbi:MAG TPA: BTAD domain-containing putative transcriptional regulator [Acidimicrobiales bacterium]|nr:BTAD domain-containing putative transcriptional regulator [Acidimicrobiales bacterium]